MKEGKVYNLRTIIFFADLLMQGNSKCVNLAQAVQVFRRYGWNVIKLADEDKYLLEKK
ncbi:MAG: hypothetical protein IJZ46_00445 [Bacilli bacterium]|nr:hypothetical protein [Bacilli bacterium]